MSEKVELQSESDGLNSDVEKNTAPAMEIDFGIGRIYVQGDEDSSLSDVKDEFNRQKQDMMENIYDLKRHDYELREEFENDTMQGQSFS